MNMLESPDFIFFTLHFVYVYICICMCTYVYACVQMYDTHVETRGQP